MIAEPQPKNPTTSATVPTAFTVGFPPQTNKTVNKLLAITQAFFSVIIIMTAVSSCSTQKNTAKTRWWHAFTAKYNIYYNGTLAYIDGSLEKENSNKDNFTEMLPLYTVGNKSNRETGKSKFDIAIEKSKKAIRLHSINKRPEWTKNRKKTARDLEWLNRKEYNPFLWKAWMLMGRSQFHKGAFDEAASTFSYMSRLYRTQPAIYGKAQAWLAKCYIEQDWLYDAEDIIRNMSRDSIDWRARKEWDYTLADYHLHTGNLEQASQYLRKVVKHEMRSKQRAREYYLLGQVEAAMGHNAIAYKAFRKVLKQNPPYELAFNARISMSEVLAGSGQGMKMIGRLKRMAHNDNNKEYLDQVFYAIGNIYLAQKDTANAIIAYEKGNEKATRSGVEKGVLLLHLGDIYWQKEKYGDAKRCYGEAIGLIDKERKDYQQLSERSKVLDELVPYTDAIYLQDSLQSLARMSEKERNEAIDRVITALKKKEKEEKDREAEEYANKQLAQNNSGMPQKNVAKRPTGSKKSTAWYFYSASAVQQGKQLFERKWGKRENQDDWQRANKTVVNTAISDDDMAETTDSLHNDSIASGEETADESKAVSDSLANDPHKREYYLAQIPFTPEQLEESNEVIKDGLFHSGIIFKDKLDNLALSEKAFRRLINDYPDFEPMDEVYYHLFLLYSRKDDAQRAQQNIENLKSRYPDSRWTAILTDPYFEENARFGEHIEDSLYAATYNAFLSDDNKTVKENTKVSDSRFPMGANRDKFMFISSLSLLNEGDIEGCLKRLEQLVNEFPQGKPSEMAGMIINGVNAGRRLHGSHFSMIDVWNRRTAIMADSDSIAMKTLSLERDVPFTFMLVYEPDSVNENKMLYQLARFNFTNFIVRNFEMEITDDNGLHRMNVTGFRSYDEAKLYARVLYKNDAMKEIAKHCHPVIIADENVPLLGETYSYNDYDTFYVAHFQPLKIKREYMLYEPDAVRETKTKREPVPALPSESAAPKGVAPVEQKTEEKEGLDVPEEEVNPAQNESYDIPIEVKSDSTSTEETVIPFDNKQEKAPDEDVIIVEENAKEAPQNDVIIIDEQKDEAPDEDIIIIEDDKNKEQTEQKKEQTPVTGKGNTEQKKEQKPVTEKEKTQTKHKNNSSTTAKEKKTEEKKEKKQNDKDEEIIFEEEKKDSSELEDEYYELEGF